jgi:peptidyl-prolyl cis-trans isomerase D
MMRAAGLDRRILGGLIRDAAFDEELAGLGILAPNEAVVEAIRADPAFRDVSGAFSDQSYQFVLSQMGMSAREFEDSVATRLARGILNETTEAAISPPPGASARIAAYQGESRGVSTLTLTLDMAPDPGTPDEGALRAFYEANEPMFTEPERRWGEYLHIDTAILLAKLVPDEATLRAAYEANIDAYSVEESRVIDQIAIPDRDAAEAAMARLVSGDATFETLGAEYGLEAGDLSLGRVTPSDLPDSAAALIFDEEKPGIIGPVALPVGFAVFRIREITEGGSAPFEDLRDQIADRLASDEMQVRAPEIANKIDELRAEGLSMTEIAANADIAQEVAYGTFGGLARDATLAGGTDAEGFLASAPLISEVFAALDAEERDLTRAVTAWQTAERLKALQAQAGKLTARLGDDASIWDIGEELGVAAMMHNPFTRMNPPAALPGPLIEKIFRAQITGGASAPDDEGTGVIVAQIYSITALAPEAMAANSAGLDQVLADSMQTDMAEYFARAVEARHETFIDPGVIDEVFRQLGAVGGNPAQ